MNNGLSSLREFGNCRLDLQKKLLWAEDRPVQLPLKAIELLCVLVEGRGQVLSKDEIWTHVWSDAFVEETNLTHNIYLLRKALNGLGHKGLIETVPRRGYRFSGTVHEIPDEEIVLQRHALTRTTIEVQETEAAPIAVDVRSIQRARMGHRGKTVALATVVLIAVLGAAAIWRLQSSLARTEAAGIRSIAVLPLRSLNESDDDKLLSSGIADALITSLGSVNKVRVISTGTVGAKTDPQEDPFEIGKNLAVDSVLDGTFQKANGKLRVTLRLIRTADGQQVWSRSFDESETEIFRLQDMIAAETARSLKLNLSNEEQRKIVKRYTENREAYEAYLRGCFFFDKRTAENYEKAIAEFEQAIKLDPNYALALTGLADVYALQANSADSAELRDAQYERSRAIASKALQLDESLPEVHTTLGWIKRTHDWDWAGSEAEFKRALELNPNHVHAHQWYSLLLTTLGRTDDALREIQIARDLAPLSTIILQNYLAIAQYHHDFDKLAAIGEQIRSLDGDNGMNILNFSQAAARTGDYAKVIELGEAYLSGNKGDLSNYQAESLAVAYHRTGRTAKATEIIRILEQRSRKSTHALYQLARVQAELGQKEQAIISLQKCLEARDERLVWLKVEPDFDPLRNDPRFKEMLKKMDLL